MNWIYYKGVLKIVLCEKTSLIIYRKKMSRIFAANLFLFQSTPCKHPVIVLQDVAWTDLHALVEFIYHGEVNVHQRSLSSFLKTAEVLRVSGLTQQQHGDDHDQVNLLNFCFPTLHSLNWLILNYVHFVFSALLIYLQFISFSKNILLPFPPFHIVPIHFSKSVFPCFGNFIFCIL